MEPKVLQMSGRFRWTDSVDGEQGVCVCVCYNIFQMCAPCHLDSTGCTVCACVCVRVCACVCVCVCYAIFEMFEACHVNSADFTVCLCLCLCLSQLP